MALNQNFTVKNNLNTLGSILSSGVDISTSFSPSSLYTLVNTNSASWSGGGSLTTTFQAQSANNISVYNNVNSLSGNWNTSYASTTALNLSAGNWNMAYASTVALNLSTANWNLAYTAISSQSLTATYLYGKATESVFTDGSNLNGNGGGTLSLNYLNGVYASSPIYYNGGSSDQWNSSYTSLNTLSAGWLTSVNGTSNQIVANTVNGVVTLSLPSSITTPGDLSVGGNLYFGGSAIQLVQNELVVQDPIIYLSESNPADSLDIGVVGHNVVGGVYGHTGLLRTHGIGNPGIWYLFSSMSTEPSANSVSTNTKTIDTLVANTSGSHTGNATTATTLQNARNFSLGSGDVTSPTVSFDGSSAVSLATTIANNAVTYGKFQQVGANKVLGNSTGSTANVAEIPASSTGLSLLNTSSAAAGATTLGLGTTNNVTFASVSVSNGTQTTNNNIFYGTTSTNTLVVPTFIKTTYNTAKYVVQIKRSGGASAAMEILVNYNTGNTTWEGTVYGLLDSGGVFTNVDVATSGTTIDLSFTFNGNATYNVTVIGQAM